MLGRARQAEQNAVGAQRRRAFWLTRTLIAGARVAGYTSADLARCLGISVVSVRDRRGNDGWVRASEVRMLTGWSATRVRQWQRSADLTQCHRDATGEECYLASDLIRAVGGGVATG